MSPRALDAPFEMPDCWIKDKAKTTTPKADPAMELIEGGKQAAADEAPPWEELPDANEGAALLDAVHHFLGRFIRYPCVHTQVAHALWIVHTHCLDAFDSTPRIAFLSPEPASGKTRALEVSCSLVPRPVEAVNVSAAYMFRKVADPDGRPTILHDEIDTVFGPKAKDNEETRGLLNAGHRKGAIAGRCVVKGKKIETEDIPAFSAVAMAGLGGLPDTIISRAVVVRMRRRMANEKIEQWRNRIHKPQGEKIRERIAKWARVTIGDTIDEWPELPDAIQDRDADVWEALFVVADRAGGQWPALCKDAALALIGETKDSSVSLGVRLLTDLHAVFGEEDRLSTKRILEHLYKLDQSPWKDFKGVGLTDRQMARLLRPYAIKPKDVRFPQDGGDLVLRGYDRADFADSWQRYVPSASPQETATTTTTATGALDLGDCSARSACSAKMGEGGR